MRSISMIAATSALLFTSHGAFAASEAARLVDPGEVKVTLSQSTGDCAYLTREEPARFYGSRILELGLERLTAKAGEGVSLRDGRKICQASLAIEAPEGWTYAVAGVYTVADLALPRATSGETRVSTYFQGAAETVSLARTYEGPVKRYFARFIAPDRLAYAPCDAERALNVKAEVRAASGDTSHDSDELAVVSLDGPLYLVLKWQRCDELKP